MFFINDKQVSMEEVAATIKTGDVGIEGRRPDWNIALDIVCFTIQHDTGSWANHAFDFTGQFIDPPGGPFGLKCTKRDWLIIQAIARGVTVSLLSDYAGNGHIVKFVRHAQCTDEDRPEIVKTMFKEVDHRYDWGALFGFFLRPVWPFKHNPLSDHGRYFCSEGVANAYAQRRLFWRTDVDPSYISPGDIWGSGSAVHY